MSNPVSPASSAPEVVSAVTTSRSGAEVSQSRQGASSSSTVAADYRLIIEESDPGHYVYTVVDRRSGDVVSQLPREEVLRLKDQPGYSAGDLFKGKA